MLSNKKNSYKIKLAKNTKLSKLVRMIKDKYELSWNLEGANHSKAEAILLNENYSDELSVEKKKNLLRIWLPKLCTETYSVT